MKLKENQTLLAAAVAAVVGLTPLTAAHSQENEGDSSNAEEVIVTGVRQAIQNAQDMKRDATEIIEAVTFEDVGKYTDENLAETLQRVPGLQIDRDEDGAGRYISIRGLGPRFNTTTVNGRGVAGGAGGPQQSLENHRAFDFGVLAPEMVGGVRIDKSPSANKDAGGLGGVVDVQTLKPLDVKQDGVFSFRGSANAIYRDSSETYDPRLSGLFNFVVNEQFGLMLNVATSENSSQTQVARLVQTNTANTINGVDNVLRPNNNANYSMGETSNETDGFGLVAQWQPSDDLDIVFDYGFNSSLRENVDNTLRFKPVGTPTADEDGVLPVNFADVGGILHAGDYTSNGAKNAVGNFTESSYDREDSRYGVHLTYNPNSGPWTFDFDIARSESELFRINKVASANYTDSKIGGTRWEPDVSNGYVIFRHLPNEMGETFDPLNPESVALGNLGYNMINIDNSFDNLAFDVDWEVDWGAINKVEFGVKRKVIENNSIFNVIRFNNGSKNNALNNSGIAPADQPAATEFENTNVHYPGGGFLDEIPNIAREWFALDGAKIYDYWDPILNAPGVVANGNLPIPDGGWFVKDPAAGGNGGLNRFLASEETVDAAYVQFNFSGDMGTVGYRGNFGLRYVSTDIKGTGYRSSLGQAPFLATDTGGYDDILPSANITFEFTEELLLRFAASQVIAFPDVRDISGSTNVNIDQTDDEERPILDDVTGMQVFLDDDGNPTTEVDPVTGNRLGTAQFEQLDNITVNFKTPELDPFKAFQYETIIEWYPGDTGASLTAGLFVKDIDSFPATLETFPDTFTADGVTIPLGGTFNYRDDGGMTVTSNTVNEIKVRTPQNVDEGAKISGGELQGHLPFEVFTDNDIISDFGIRASYTTLFENESGILDPITGEKLPLEGASEDNFSTTFYYDNGTISARMNYTYRGSTLRSPSNQGGALFDDSYQVLGGNINYKINKSLSARFSMSNILEDPRTQSFADGLFPYATRQSGKSYTLGLTYKFK